MMQGDNSRKSEFTKGEASALSPFFRLETLKSRQMFKQAASGPRFSTPAFTMLRRPLGEAEQSAADAPRLRFGFTVTKKIGGAVERNRIRRRLKAAVSAAAPGFPQVGMDLVLLARNEAMTIAFSALVQDIARAVSALERRGGAGKPRARRETAPEATKTGEIRPTKLGKPGSPD